MNSVLLSKQLFNKATELYSPADEFSHGLTVSLLQDSAEMLIWEMAKHFDIDLQQKDGFVSIIKNLDKNHVVIEIKTQIFELNHARVNFKHYGNLPSPLDVPRHIEACRLFLVRNSSKIGVDFEALSSADTVLIPKVREYLKNSEELLEKDEFEEALIQSSIAFQELETLAYEKLGVDEYDLRAIEEAFILWPEGKQDYVREFTSKLTTILDNTVQHISKGMFGYTPEYVNSVKKMCYGVNVTVGGNVVGSSNMGGVKLNIESIRYVNNFIIEASRRL